MKTLIMMLFLASPLAAGEYAILNSSGVVVQVIVADSNYITTRTDGPWVPTFGKAGIGWQFNPINQGFTAPISTEPSAIPLPSKP